MNKRIFYVFILWGQIMNIYLKEYFMGSHNKYFMGYYLHSFLIINKFTYIKFIHRF